MDQTTHATQTTSTALRIVGVIALLAQAGVHLQQWLGGLSAVSVVGPMFIANAVLAGLAAVGVAVRGGRLSALAGIAISLGALVALGLAFTVGLFGFQTAGLTRTAILVAVGSEVVAIAALGVYLSRSSG